MSAMPVAARPGTTFFAPGVRIVKLDRQLRAGAEAGDALPALDPDILRVEVTRENNGASQYSIILNNWFDTLPADRRDGLGAGERTRGGRPLFPRYKYNDFAILGFGDRLRIDMRYHPDPAPGIDPTAAAAQKYVPMVAGPITDMRFSFSPGEGAQVTVSGEDDLSRLKDKFERRIEFNRLSERSIVRRVLAEVGYPLATIAAPAVEWPDFAEDDGRGISEALQDGQAPLEFLQKLAETLDFEVFVEFADLADPASGQEFHFEPARSRRPPAAAGRETFILRRDRNLVDFTPTIKVADQFSEVVVKGRHRDRQRPERIVQPAAPAVVGDELHVDPAQDRPLRSGPEIRARFFPDRPNKAEAPNQSNIDPERAAVLAAAILRKKARELLTIEGSTVGLPRLRPGNHVEIRGFRPPFDGFYYLTKTVHSFGADGLRTRFSARRPGMPEPPYDEA